MCSAAHRGRMLLQDARAVFIACRALLPAWQLRARQRRNLAVFDEPMEMVSVCFSSLCRAEYA